MENHALNFVIPNCMSFFFSCTKHKKGNVADCTVHGVFFSFSEIEWQQWMAVHFH